MAVQDPIASMGRGQVDKCDVCGEDVPIGGWFACKSRINPEGHSKGVTYRWRTKFSMKLQGWTRRER